MVSLQCPRDSPFWPRSSWNVRCVAHASSTRRGSVRLNSMPLWRASNPCWRPKFITKAGAAPAGTSAWSSRYPDRLTDPALVDLNRGLYSLTPPMSDVARLAALLKDHRAGMCEACLLAALRLSSTELSTRLSDLRETAEVRSGDG